MSKKSIIKIIFALIFLALIGVTINSLVRPFDRLGYKTLIYDSRSKVYANNERFSYGPYEFTVDIQLNDVQPALLTCDGDETILTHQECLELNRETREETKQRTYIDVVYTIKNTSDIVRKIDSDWLKIYNNGGTLLLTAPSGMELAPGTSIRNTMREIIDRSDASFISGVVSLPWRAQQSVVFTE